MIDFFLKDILYVIITFIAGLYLIELNIKKNSTLYFQNLLSIVSLGLFSLLFGTADVSPKDINDLGMYYRHYNTINTFSDIFLQKSDYLFYFVFFVTKKIYNDFNFTLTVVALLYNTFIYLALKKLSKNYYFLLFILVSYFFYYNMGSNILRQGVGFSFFMYAIAFFYNNNIKKYFLFSIIALGFHFSFILPITILLAMKYLRSLKVLLSLYVISSIISLLRIKVLDFLMGIPLVSAIYSKRTDFNVNYFDYNVGFRSDFYIFNTFFMIIFYITYTKIISLDEKKKYYIFLGTYIILSCYFFLMFEFPFSDRYGILSWAFIPILFLPYVNKEPLKKSFMNINFIYGFSILMYLVFNVMLRK